MEENVAIEKSSPSTPLLIKIMVIAIIWYFAAGITRSVYTSNLSILTIGSIFVQVVALIAIWKLKRWGLYVWIAISAVNIGMTLFGQEPAQASNVTVAIIIFRLVPIIVPLFYWKKFA